MSMDNRFTEKAVIFRSANNVGSLIYRMFCSKKNNSYDKMQYEPETHYISSILRKLV